MGEDFLTLGDVERIKRLHLLLAFYNAFQPGVFALSGWDLVGALTLPQGAVRVLTNRELEIVRLVATGLRNKQIADQLSITEGTVKIHLHTIFEKLGVSSRVELSNYARERSLL